MSYQIKKDLPSPFGGIVWLGLAQSRNTPYVPFYGLVNDTYGALLEVRSAKYDPTSWYWAVLHIDQMVMKYPDLFLVPVSKIKWKEMEGGWSRNKLLWSKYSGLTDDQAKALQGEVTRNPWIEQMWSSNKPRLLNRKWKIKMGKEKGLKLTCLRWL